jgi:hypothetical protein
VGGLHPLKAPDVERMLAGVEVIPEDVPNVDGFSMIPATTA